MFIVNYFEDAYWETINTLSANWIVITLTILVPFLLSFIVEKQHRNPICSIGTIAFSLYAIYAMTISERIETSAPKRNFDLFWTWEKALEGSGLHQYFIIGNILLFIPLGISVTAAFPAARRKWWLVTLVGCVVSGIVEGIQYFRHLGLCELDDILHNTIGMLIGYLIVKLVVLLRNAVLHHINNSK